MLSTKGISCNLHLSGFISSACIGESLFIKLHNGLSACVFLNCVIWTLSIVRGFRWRKARLYGVNSPFYTLTSILRVISTGVLISGRDWFLSCPPRLLLSAFKAVRTNFPSKSSISKNILKSWKTCPTLNTNVWWNGVSCPESPVGYLHLHCFHLKVIWNCTLLKLIHISSACKLNRVIP